MLPMQGKPPPFRLTLQPDFLPIDWYGYRGQVNATDWMWSYNHERPNMALGGITPKQKSALLTRSTTDRC